MKKNYGLIGTLVVLFIVFVGFHYAFNSAPVKKIRSDMGDHEAAK